MIEQMMGGTTMDYSSLLIAFMAGASLGVVYFYLLWISVQRLTQRGGAPLFVVGIFGRFALVLLALFWLFAVMHGGLPEVGAALVGFVVARLVAMRLPQPRKLER